MANRQRKARQRELLRARASAAIQDLYHNASVEYPRIDGDFEQGLFNDWFQDAPRAEIDYIQNGGAYGDLASTCRHIRTQYKSSDAANRAETRYRTQARVERAGHAAAWECISEFGELWQYGRGGKTLAPKNLIEMGGGGRFSTRKDYFEGERVATYAEMTRSIVIIESFNAHVAAWCKDVPTLWHDHKAESGLDLEIAAEPVKRRILESFEDSLDYVSA